MANNEIKIPEQHYVTFQKRKDSSIPIAFLTPYGTDKAAQTRMSTADNWAYGPSNSPQIKARIIDNKPMAGFIIKTNIQRYSTSNVVWRVEDPRGFELEISSGNLADLIQICTIENGEILTPCVWSRQRANNVLLPESSEEYQAAIENTKRINKKISIKNVNIGNKVLLHSGEEAIYMGSHHLIKIDQEEISGTYHRPIKSKKRIVIDSRKKHFFYFIETVDQWRGGPNFKGVSSAKISEILDNTTTMTIAEAEKFMNEKIFNLEAGILNGSGSIEYYARGVVANDAEIEKIDLVQIDDVESYLNDRNQKAINSKIWWSGQYIVTKENDVFYVKMCSTIDLAKISNHNTYSFKLFELLNADEYGFIDDSIEPRCTPNSFYSQNRYIAPLFDVKNIEWYCIEIVLLNQKTNNTFNMVI